MLMRVHEHIASHFSEHLESVRTFVRQPSISGEDLGITETADMLAQKLKGLGAQTEIAATDRHPVVYGNLDAGASRTLLLYGMYDVQPTAGETWSVPDPFGAEVVDLPNLGPSVVSRGVYNSKGPLIGFLNVIESIQAVAGHLPLNLKFMVEGEEELGSPHLPDFVDRYRSRLRADFAYFPAYSQEPSGKVVMHLGCKGELFFELVVRGGEWGGPTRGAVHGSTAVWFHSPTFLLAQALASLISYDQKRVLVKGFTEDLAPPGQEDEELLTALARTVETSSQLSTYDVRRFKYDLTGIELLRKYLYEPSLNIDGLVSGHPGKGTKTILPHEATAKMDVRMPPRMRAERVIQRIREHLDEHGFKEVEIRVDHSFPWSRVSVKAPPVRALIDTYRSFGLEPEIWPLQAGSAPFNLFTDVLGIPFVIGGLGHGARAHSPDEYATLDGMKLYEKSVASFLYKLAEV